MNIYLSTTEDFENNGLGFLTDIISAKVTEALNGEYQLEVTYPRDGLLSEYLIEENIIKSKVADGSYQLFRINYVKKDFDTIQITAFHIFYDLLNNFLEDTYPQNLNAQTFLSHILTHTQFENNFEAMSDITSIASARYVRKNPVEVIMSNQSNSIINLFGGEIKRDNFKIKVLSRIGSDNGVKLFVGKNITGLDLSIDITNMATKIMPQGFDGLLLPELYVDSPLINNYPTPKIKKIEFSDVKYDPEDESAYHSLNEAYEELRRLSNEQYALGIDKPNINIKIDWIELSKTNEYKQYSNLEKVNLGDTVTAYLLGIEYETRVVKTIYNPITDMTEKFEIGSIKPSIGNSINKLNQEVEEMPTSVLKQATDSATNLINSAMGGYIYKTQTDLYIMDTNDPTTAQKVWRWNLNGLGYSSTGIDGPYGLAMTMDGQIVADFITVGSLRTNVIEGYDSLILQVQSNTEGINNVNNLIEDAKTGITNTFSEAGGNNIFRNTGLWFESDENNSNNMLYPSSELFPSDETFLGEVSAYEYWNGNVKKSSNINATDGNSMLLQVGKFTQEQEVPNGNYSISFYYQKLIQLANATVTINDKQYSLDSMEVKQFYTGEQDSETGEYITQPITVTAGKIKIEFYCDTRDGVEIYDLMCNKGAVRLAYSQNQNETTTDTVNISKGITITSSNMATIFKANANGIKILTLQNAVIAYFTDKGLSTKELIVENKAQMVGTLVQEVGDQTWFIRM